MNPWLARLLAALVAEYGTEAVEALIAHFRGDVAAVAWNPPEDWEGDPYLDELYIDRMLRESRGPRLRCMHY